ncbi:MAG: hypothetical protein C0617_14235 [Desulfuromonas sp.]|uniref:DsrE family protein n=1 Tax=Desulfuromonas sp. TaxID=892 RepID=UPI000CAD062C|nr:hypothetical protein [Desulfuromonas sp.]PLX82285.1 MAG: hypothetical protein C0617_14235 [Desulfuromonas sp.]
MTMKKGFLLLLGLTLLILAAGCGSDSDSPATPSTPNDMAALAGVDVGKGLFDVNIGVTPETFDASMGKLALYLDVIRQTHDGLEAQGAAADIIVAVRGSAVTLVTGAASDDVKGLVTTLAGMGVTFEACNVATALTGTPNDAILPEIKVVGNTFISAIGYQAKGYSPILIQ